MSIQSYEEIDSTAFHHQSSHLLNYITKYKPFPSKTFYSFSSNCMKDSLVLLSSSSRTMGVVVIVVVVDDIVFVVIVIEVIVEAFSADIRMTPSEQKLRSGPTMVGELDRESLGEEALARELRLAVRGSRTLTGDPVNDVIEASSVDVVIIIIVADAAFDPVAGMGWEEVVELVVVVTGWDDDAVVVVVVVALLSFCPEEVVVVVGVVVERLAIESADFPRAEGGELWGVEEELKFRKAGSVTFSMNLSNWRRDSEQWSVSRGRMDGMPSPQVSSFSFNDAAVT